MKSHSNIRFAFLVFLANQAFAQQDSAWTKPAVVQISGFVDVFHAFDFNQPTSNFRQTFLYNYNRHNEVNLNMGYLKLAVEHARYRANIALQAGTYPNDNYAAEPGLLKNIFEANAGISLNSKNSLWLDAGIFASHIGFETAVSIENWNLTRSLLAENSPYYLSGAKLTLKPNPSWELVALVCNGWQHIQKVRGNSLPSFGTQVKFTPSAKTTVNWSTFLGTDDPDTSRRMRYFSNLFGQFKLSDRWGIMAGFDLGAQQQAKTSTTYDVWLSPVLIVHYSFNNSWAAVFRAEYYNDKTGIIIQTGTANGFKTTGLSFNVDYTPIPNVACRVESRWLHSKDNIFEKQRGSSNNNIFITASIAVKFARQISKP